jgi:hypothetical protein
MMYGRQICRAEEYIDAVDSVFQWMLPQPPHTFRTYPEFVNRYGELASTFRLGRWFFTTRNGWMGLGPEKLQPGDKVCILFGEKFPCVLRPMGDYHQFLGECYVHSIMDGEAASMCAAERSILSFGEV